MWKGRLRFDIIMFITYECLLVFDVQQLMPVFLEYTPKKLCGNIQTAAASGTNETLIVCEKVEKRCYYHCANCTDFIDGDAICTQKRNQEKTLEPYCIQRQNSTTREDFQSANMEYHTGCNVELEHFPPTTAQYLGVIIGGAFLGPLADLLGRRTIVIFSLVLGIVGIVCAAALEGLVNYYGFRFLVGVAVAGTISIGWSYCSEVISPHHRFHLRTYSNWANARLILTLMVFISGSWRVASYVTAASTVVPLVLMLILPESPIWLKRKGKAKRYEAAITRIKWLNGTLREVSKSEHEDPKQEEQHLDYVFKDIFSHSRLRKHVLLLFLMWFTNGLIVYTLDLNGAEMTDNLWLSQVASGVTYSVLQITIGLLDSRLACLGRRMIYITGLACCIAGTTICLALSYAGHKEEWYYMAAYLLAYAGCTVCWDPCYMAASELIPTELRANVGSISNMLARVGALLASQTKFLRHYHDQIFYIFILLVAVPSLLVQARYLPETKGVDLEHILPKKDDKFEDDIKKNVDTEVLRRLDHPTDSSSSNAKPKTGSDNPPATGSDKPAVTGSDKPAATGSDKPPAAGSDKPPETGSEKPPEAVADKPPETGADKPAAASDKPPEEEQGTQDTAPTAEI